jgi:hypothetical protein
MICKKHDKLFNFIVRVRGQLRHVMNVMGTQKKGLQEGRVCGKLISAQADSPTLHIISG